MENKTELQEFIYLCEDIAKLKNIIYYKHYTIDTLIEMLGDSLYEVRRRTNKEWIVIGGWRIPEGKRYGGCHMSIQTVNQSARIALARAVIEIMKGDKNGK